MTTHKPISRYQLKFCSRNQALWQWRAGELLTAGCLHLHHTWVLTAVTVQVVVLLPVFWGNEPSRLSGSKAKLNDTSSTFLPFPIFRSSVPVPRAVNITRRACSAADWSQFLVLTSDGGPWQGTAGPLDMNEHHFFMIVSFIIFVLAENFVISYGNRFWNLHNPLDTICTAKWTLYVPHSGHYMYRTVDNICTAQWTLYVPQSGHYMYRTVVTICTAQWSLFVPPVNTQQFYVLPTQSIFMFCVDMRTNSDYFPIHH
jgi:hypothetical protein